MENVQNRKWTKEEIEYLQENWGNVNINTIKNKLNRTATAILVKAKRIGLGGASENSYRYITANKAAKLLNCEKHKILKWIHSGKMKAKFMSLTGKEKVWCINFEYFIEFLKANKEKWDSAKMEEYALGQEFDWLVEKRKKDRIKSPVTNYYTSDDENNIYKLIEEGYTYKQIGIELGRTERAIGTKIRKMYRKKCGRK